jgi:hypothetical protein
MIYNDAYSVFAGGRHPQLLGSKVREGWPEVADFNDNVMKVGMAGDTLSYRDQELTLHRSGAAEQVFMNLDYSPVFGEGGKAGGLSLPWSLKPRCGSLPSARCSRTKRGFSSWTLSARRPRKATTPTRSWRSRRR